MEWETFQGFTDVCKHQRNYAKCAFLMCRDSSLETLQLVRHKPVAKDKKLIEIRYKVNSDINEQ